MSFSALTAVPPTTSLTEDPPTPPTPILSPSSPEIISPVLRPGKFPKKVEHNILKRKNALYFPTAGSEVAKNYTLEELKILKLLKNTKKAMSECYPKEKDSIANKENYLGVEKIPTLQDIQKALKNEISVSIEHAEKTDIGYKRTENQDAFLFKETDHYVLAAVFDGFGDYDKSNRSGKYVSSFVKNHFEGHFERALSRSGCPKTAIQTLFNEAQLLLDFEKVKWPGTTACVNFIDKHHGLLYTTTLGDTQSFTFRFQEEKAMIPNSVVRDWKSVKDRNSVAKHVNEKFIKAELDVWNDENASSKKLKICHTNVSRAIGFGARKTILDSKKATPTSLISFDNKQPIPLTLKGKCSVKPLEEGDIILIACDGLWDYVNQDDINNTLNEYQNDLSISIDKLTALAKNNMEYGFDSQREKKRVKGGDNVTIIALKVKIDASNQTIQEPPLKKVAR